MNRRNFFLLIITILSISIFSACAIKTSPTTLQLTAEAISVKCGNASQAPVGIAPAFDERPDAEKEGSKAKGLYLLLWNQRKGNYTSSDKDLGGDIASTVTNLVKETIEKSNCARDVKILTSKMPSQPHVENLLVAFAQDQVKYVLTIHIKHLYGQQGQDAKLIVIPAYFVNAASWGNAVGAANGWTEILFTLYDTNSGYEVWRENIQASTSSLEKGAYAEVAREATIQLLEDFASRFEKAARVTLGAS